MNKIRMERKLEELCASEDAFSWLWNNRIHSLIV
jgi:hypothetical protein